MRPGRRDGDDEPQRCPCHGVPVAFVEDASGAPVAVCSIDEAGLEQLTNHLERLVPFDPDDEEP